MARRRENFKKIPAYYIILKFSRIVLAHFSPGEPRSDYYYKLHNDFATAMYTYYGLLLRLQNLKVDFEKVCEDTTCASI